MNKFKYSDDNKRYHTFNYYLKHKYNQKIAKVCLDAGFTCPNRDGKKGYGGCIFCSARGSGDYIYNEKNILTQYEKGKELIKNKWPQTKFIAYFQAYTNTYGPLTKIKTMLEPFIDMDEVVSISIATRPDCLEDETIAYLDEVSKKKELWLELGLQTSNEATSNLINRGHDFQTLVDAVKKLNKTSIKICIHIINSLPYETKEDMIKTVKDISNLDFHGLKIHMLSVCKNTKLEKMYKETPFDLLSLEDYVEVCVEQLRYIKPEVVIQRLTGDPVKEDLIAPTWLLNKTRVLNEIDKYMAKNNIYQGDKR